MPAPQPIPVGPLTGVLDLRSSPETIPRDALRMRQNFRTVGQGTLRRGNGFEKLLNTSNYNNADFHDQLLSLSGASMRQPVTLQYEAISTRKIRSLIIGTQGTLAQLNGHTGNYRILGSGFGGTASASANAPRFKAAQVGDYVAFTNDFDKPKYVVLEQAPDATSGSLIYEFDDLVTIGLSRAKHVWSWKGVIFFANVEMDSERVAYRIVWGDFDNPTSFDPAKLDSIAGFKDLYTYETILGGAPFGNSFLIYTTHGIWEMIADPDQTFAVRRVYDGEKDEFKCVLKYPNTLVPIHDGHCYLAGDGAYFFSQYYPMPDRPEWLHRSTFDLYKNIDNSVCEAHIGAIFGDEIYFSVATVNAVNACPDYTLRVNKTYKVCDFVDTGFTSLCQFKPMDVATVRDFIVDNNICTLAGLNSAGYGYVKEGLPRTLPTGTAGFTPAKFYTDVTQSIAYSGTLTGTLTVEDWNQASASSDSLCALLAGERLDEICRQCEPIPLLVGASSTDLCLKQLTDVFYREICLNPTAVGTTDSNGYTASVPSYALNSITSVLRFAAATMADAEVIMEALELKYLAADQNPPLNMSLRIGISAQPADANTGEGIVWYQRSAKPLAFQSSKTMAQHIAANTIPFSRMQWNYHHKGRYIHVELTLTGVGGDSLFGSIEGKVYGGGRTINC